MARIFYAEDDGDTRRAVVSILKCDNHEVTAFTNGDELLAAFDERLCDLILLDIMMPGSDGLSVMRRIRNTSSIPIVLLTAKNSDIDCFNGLSLGGDDYLPKPFKPMMLSAEINALLRRVHLDRDNRYVRFAHDIACGNAQFSSKDHCLFIDGEPVALTPTELEFLLFLMERFGEAVPQEEVLRAVWDISPDIKTRAAEETNRRVRKKLAQSGANITSQTIWGFGYKLNFIDEK